MHLRVSLSISAACLSFNALACSSNTTPGGGGFGATGTSGTSVTGASGTAKSGASGTAQTGTTGTSTTGSATGATGTSGSAPSGSQTGASGASGTTPPPLAGPPAGPYTVSGPTILDKNGQPHLFRGVDRPSLEWSCSGDIKTDEYDAIKSWGANVVRVGLNQDCWLNDPANRTYDAMYALTVEEQVQLAKAAGLDIILDLHWSDQGNYTVGAACQPLGSGNCQQDMADAHSVLFWQQLATKYANDPAVLFELYNEPKVGGYMPGQADWTTWLSGGTSSGFAVHGMQELYTTVRATGANNLIIIGGLAWAYDLTGVATHPVTGTGIIYNTHPYNTSTNANPAGWANYFGNLTSTYPVIATEFGDRSQTQATACNSGFDASFIPFTNGKASGANPAHAMSWTAWAFYASTCAFPSLLADSNFTPNAPGMVVKDALLAGP